MVGCAHGEVQGAPLTQVKTCIALARACTHGFRDGAVRLPAAVGQPPDVGALPLSGSAVVGPRRRDNRACGHHTGVPSTSCTGRSVGTSAMVALQALPYRRQGTGRTRASFRCVASRGAAIPNAARPGPRRVPSSHSATAEWIHGTAAAARSRPFELRRRFRGAAIVPLHRR